ncbi:MAG: F420-dependent oxidoreductase-like protein [Acidimicrobiales bacterium]|jgi:F420-dependent oxidoreductase-like protein
MSPQPLRTSIQIGNAYYDGAPFEDTVAITTAADSLGVDFAWSAEAWGMETIAPLAYLAAVTDNIKLGTGIMQISARVPAMTAMTSLTMAMISNDRFCLGLGVSGPQVVEGLHGAAFAKPLGRLREYTEIVRMAIDGERIVYDGQHYELPRPGGEGKALKLGCPPKPDLPIYLATLGPKSLEFTGEAGNGWLGTSFIPEHANIFFDPIAAGAERVGRSLADIDLQVGGAFEVSGDIDGLIERYRPSMAFVLGAMGSAKTNFYNAAYSRAGYADAAAEVQSLWVGGDKTAATAAVPDEMVLAANLIGDEGMVSDRIRAYQEAGVNTLRLGVTGKTVADRISNLEQAVGLVADATTPGR